MTSTNKTLPLLSLLTIGIMFTMIFATIRFFVHDDLVIFTHPDEIPHTITEKIKGSMTNSQQP